MEILGGEIEKSEKSGNFPQVERRQSYHVAIILIHCLVKFSEEMIIFDEIRGHLVILSFCRARAKTSGGSSWKQAI